MFSWTGEFEVAELFKVFPWESQLYSRCLSLKFSYFQNGLYRNGPYRDYRKWPAEASAVVL